jgi:hypothetical protein
MVNRIDELYHEDLRVCNKHSECMMAQHPTGCATAISVTSLNIFSSKKRIVEDAKRTGLCSFPVAKCRKSRAETVCEDNRCKILFTGLPDVDLLLRPNMLTPR